MDLNKYLFKKRGIINEALDKYLPSENEYPQILHEAMRYSVLSSGKRLRPILTIATYETIGGKQEEVIPISCAIELIHTYSLIHDDLPSLDNDDYRRGKETCHRKYGEAIAILTGDALLTFGFKLISSSGFNPSLLIKTIDELSSAIGTRGMIGGQAVDVTTTEANPSVLQYIHTHKTGALICASVRIGAILAGCSTQELTHLTQYGECIGLAFQIVDDMMDERCDKKRGKRLTYPVVYGVKEAERRARELGNNAILQLEIFGGRAKILREIARFIVDRAYKGSS
ncbi:MAG: polyprenyl synthetase family protein [bacterium]|nr:polyprenyl synthetase family protein [bacterium]